MLSGVNNFARPRTDQIIYSFRRGDLEFAVLINCRDLFARLLYHEFRWFTPRKMGHEKFDDRNLKYWHGSQHLFTLNAICGQIRFAKMDMILSKTKIEGWRSVKHLFGNFTIFHYTLRPDFFNSLEFTGLENGFLLWITICFSFWESLCVYQQ